MFLFSSQQLRCVANLHVIFWSILVLTQFSERKILYVCESLSPFYNPDEVLLPTLLAGMPSCDWTLQWFPWSLLHKFYLDTFLKACHCRSRMWMKIKLIVVAFFFG